jgi:hypothetical protein
MKTKSILSALLAIVAMASLSSCQTASSAGGPTEAVACPKCQMIAYERVGAQNKQVTVLRGETMTCPDCESAVKNYFTKGMALRHTCSSCNSKLVHCRAH